MNSRLKHTFLRLSRMSADEVRTRLSQEANKRLDVLAYKLGHKFDEAPLQSRAAKPAFFFEPQQLPQRIALLQKFLPAEAALIREEADAICQHRFNLLGYSGLDYGKEIDWHLDAVNAKSAPLKPWHKINFLDFNEVGDHKVTWELNRHQHLVTLAKAWTLTRDARYVSELVGQWQSWRRANPYPMGINWGSALEVAFRSLSWLWVANLLDESAPLPKDFRAELTRALMLNGRYIEKYLSTYFSPNTHLLGEAVALFFIGTLCPQLPRSQTWKKRGWNVILEASQRQVRPDGVYFEQALHYHVYALDFFLHARILAARNQISIPAHFDEVLERMLQVVEALSQAGPAEGFGDDDGGRVFNPRRNRTEHMTDALAIGAGVYKREHIQAAARITEEAIWLLGDEAIQSRETQATRAARSRAFASGGIYVMASSTPAPHQVVVDAGPQGTGRCGHGHADALSIRMTVNGRRMLLDPGTGLYVSRGNERDVFRGTAAHNTLRVDEQDQAMASGPFAWTAIPNTQVEHWISGNSFDFLVAGHDGYSRLPAPVRHRRFVFRAPDGIYLIRDVCDGQGTHFVESFWHFACDIQVANQDDALIATGSDHERSDVSVAFLAAPTSTWQLETGSGFVSDAYGKTSPAPMARISTKAELPVECALLMVMRKGSERIGHFSQIETGKNVSAYQYETAEGTHRFFFAGSIGNWTAAEWSSDAAFVYCVSSPAGRTAQSETDLARVILVGGSFASLGGKPIFSNAHALEHWEWPQSEAKPATVNPAMEFVER